MKLLFILALLIPILATAQKAHEPTDKEVTAAYQSIPKIDGHYEWTEVVQVDTSLKKDDLYRNAKAYFANSFKSAKDVIQYDDRDEGRVMGKGNFEADDAQSVFTVYFTDRRYVNFTVEIICKDGRYKYRIYDVQADCTTRASGGNTRDNVLNFPLTLDAAYAECNKGMTKKMDRRLFMLMLGEIHLTIDGLKKAMAQKAKDDF